MDSVNINTATVEELLGVPGLGEALVRAIVQHRETVGPFRSVGELLKVDGISERLLAKIGSMLTVGDEVPSTLEVQLKPSRANAIGDYAGYRVEATGTKRPGSDEPAIPFAATAASTAAGESMLTVPDRATLLDRVEIRAVAPDGHGRPCPRQQLRQQNLLDDGPHVRPVATGRLLGPVLPTAHSLDPPVVAASRRDPILFHEPIRQRAGAVHEGRTVNGDESTQFNQFACVHGRVYPGATGAEVNRAAREPEGTKARAPAAPTV